MISCLTRLLLLLLTLQSVVLGLAGGSGHYIAARHLARSVDTAVPSFPQANAVRQPGLLAHVGGAAAQDVAALSAQLVQRLPPRTQPSESGRVR